MFKIFQSHILLLKIALDTEKMYVVNGKNRFASQGVSLAQMMYVSKYKSHIIALFNSIKKSNLAPISSIFQKTLDRWRRENQATTTEQQKHSLRVTLDTDRRTRSHLEVIADSREPILHNRVHMSNNSRKKVRRERRRCVPVKTINT